MNVANIMAMTKVMANDSKLNTEVQGEDSFINLLSQSSFVQLEEASNESDEQLIIVDEDELLIDELVATDEEDNELFAGNEDEDKEIEEELPINFNELNYLLNETQHISDEVNASQLNVSITEDNNVIAQIQQLVERITVLLNDLDDTNVKQKSPQLLTVLKQLSQFHNGENKSEVIKLLDDEMSEEEADIVKRLLTTFQNRNNVARSGAYKFEAEVTTEDVARWLNEALNNQDVKIEQTVTVPTRVGTENVQMSPIEQYVIHLNESDRVERIQDQMIRQFETVMKQSRFLKAPDLTQLSFTLKPNNLGNVHVQLVEINGEMTVKMVASSLAAKQLLESNIHQLKHLFAPHNVIIERNDAEIDDVDQLDEQLDEQEEQAMKEEERNEQHQSNEEELEQITESFHSILQDLGINEDGEELKND